MKPVTVAEAARLTRTSKSTIQRAIKSHELSASRDDQSRWMIDPSELARVFELHHDAPMPPEPAAESVHHATPTPNHQSAPPPQESILQVKYETEREKADMYKTQVDDLQRRLDNSERERRQGSERIQALLTDQRKTSGWFSKMFA